MSEHHPLVKVLFAEIPTGPYWAPSSRALWLRAMEAAFDLIYISSEGISISIQTKPLKILSAETTEPEEEKPQATAPVQAPPAEEKAPVQEPPKNVGGRPSTVGRPDDIPTNLEMALEAIDHHEGKASAPQIRKFIAGKYWPDIREHWSSNLFDLTNKGKLARNGINFVRPAAVPEKMPAKVPTKPIVADKPAVPLPPHTVVFEFDSEKIRLVPREARLAEALRRAMGKGHLDYTFLARSGLGPDYRSSINAKNWCMEMFSVLTPKLTSINLTVTHAPDFGYSMKIAD